MDNFSAFAVSVAAAATWKSYNLVSGTNETDESIFYHVPIENHRYFHSLIDRKETNYPIRIRAFIDFDLINNRIEWQRAPQPKDGTRATLSRFAQHKKKKY